MKSEMKPKMKTNDSNPFEIGKKDRIGTKKVVDKYRKLWYDNKKAMNGKVEFGESAGEWTS